MVRICAALFLRALLLLGLPLVTAQAIAEPKENRSPVVLFVIGEAEYGTAEALPRFAKDHLEKNGFTTRFVLASSNDRASIDCHRFPDLENGMEGADLLVLSVRRRYPPKEDLARIRKWVADGKPVIAIRTSSHAFGSREKGKGYQPPEGHEVWEDFDREVLGIDYEGHFGAHKGPGPATLVSLADPALAHPVLREIDLRGDTGVSSHLYYSKRPGPDVTVLLNGKDAASGGIEPLAWVRTPKGGQRIFATSLGAAADFKERWVQNLLANAVDWTLDRAPTRAAALDPRQSQNKEAHDEPLSAEEATALLEPLPDLELTLLASEPVVEQPVFFNFDERGRMWVVQYRQYPEPAGLSLVSKDRFWRAAYDKAPPPPGAPGWAPGKDQITIHEDTDGDGSFEKVTTFLDNLNLATACVRGNGGVYILQPPYLLHYPDQNDDDVPDGDPAVLLEGFGLEDTHSLVSSLCWGPDGWLYGCQGSTVTSAVRVPGSDAEPIRRAGQLIWRYHPGRKQYEVHAEGGGNIWSCEFDSKGRIFAGANGSQPGFHYLQAAYYRKSFGKHGELSNPHAYGYFEGIEHPQWKRVTTSICVYEGGTLPDRYQGSLVWANAVIGRFGASNLKQDGLGFRGSYLDLPISTTHRWFRPVYVDFGPDGALYFSDWYDQQVAHHRNYQGRISKKDGRIYRVGAKGTPSLEQPNLPELNPTGLVEVLSHPNRWYREQAQRLLSEHPDRLDATPALSRLFREGDSQQALEALWALHRMGQFAEHELDALQHQDPHVRRWAVRLLGDDTSLLNDTIGGLLIHLAKTDQNLEVRGQLASSAQRFPAGLALPVVENLLQHSEDRVDPHQPLLLWWALEKHCDHSAREVVDLFVENTELVEEMNLSVRLTQRLAVDDPAEALRWIEAARKKAPLMTAFEESWEGRNMAELEEDLVARLIKHSTDPLPLKIRLGDVASVAKANQLLADSDLPQPKALDLLSAVTALSSEEANTESILIQLDRKEEPIQLAALGALSPIDDPEVGREVTSRWTAFPEDTRTAALQLLASRDVWAKSLVEAAKAGGVETTEIPPDVLQRLADHSDPEVAGFAKAQLRQTAPLAEEVEKEKASLTAILAAGGGDPAKGYLHYEQRCGACHLLHGKGGEIGPDLTTYQRNQTDDLLTAILAPSREIREGYGTVVIETNDGRTLSGFLSSETADAVTLRPGAGSPLVLPKKQIVKRTASEISVMPPALLTGLDDEALRDLFAFLRSAQPLNLKK